METYSVQPYSVSSYFTGCSIWDQRIWVKGRGSGTPERFKKWYTALALYTQGNVVRASHSPADYRVWGRLSTRVCGGAV